MWGVMIVSVLAGWFLGMATAVLRHRDFYTRAPDPKSPPPASVRRAGRRTCGCTPHGSLCINEV